MPVFFPAICEVSGELLRQPSIFRAGPNYQFCLFFSSLFLFQSLPCGLAIFKSRLLRRTAAACRQPPFERLGKKAHLERSGCNMRSTTSKDKGGGLSGMARSADAPRFSNIGRNFFANHRQQRTVSGVSGSQSPAERHFSPLASRMKIAGSVRRRFHRSNKRRENF